MMSRKSYRLLAYYLSIFIVMIGIIQFLPMLVIPFYPSDMEYAHCFVAPGVAAIVLGCLVRII